MAGSSRVKVHHRHLLWSYFPLQTNKTKNKLKTKLNSLKQTKQTNEQNKPKTKLNSLKQTKQTNKQNKSKTKLS